MRFAGGIVAMALLSGCHSKNTMHSEADLYGTQENADRVHRLEDAKATENARWEKEISECLPVPLDARVVLKDGLSERTVGERLRDLGARATADHTLVDRNGNVIYRCPSHDGFDANETARCFLALTGYRPPTERAPN
jgi:hypothetical protein